jgi:hypothetical protein
MRYDAQASDLADSRTSADPRTGPTAMIVISFYGQ